MKIHFAVKVSPAMVCCGVAAMLFMSSAADLSSETVTMTTSYPAPSGVYTQLVATSNAFLARDGGNIGIGTTATTYKLDVNGTARLGSNTAGGAIFKTGGGARGIIRPGIGGGSLLLSDDSEAVARGITVAAGGNVGIGKNPAVAVKLDVNGDIVARGCAAPIAVTDALSSGDVQCPDPTHQYATWTPGLMAHYQRSSQPVNYPVVITTYFFCCPCNGLCPSL